MTAPTIPTNDTNEFDGMDVMERTIQSTLTESKHLIGDEQAVTNRPRNERGQFVSQSGEDPSNEPKGAGEWNILPDAEPVAGTPSPVEGAASEPEAEPPKPVIPDGHVALPALDPAKVQGFKVMDAEGEIVPPDLKFEVNFRSKTGESQPRTLDLPQLVNYARMGVYNHEREQQFDGLTHEVQQWRATAPKFEEAVKERDARIERLLSDPSFLAQELDRYDRENTPEARAEKDRQRSEQERRQFEVEKMAYQSSVFIDTRLAPALDKLIGQFPTLEREEVASKVLRYAEPFMTDGVLPPSHHQTIAAYVVHDLYPWAERVHIDREAQKPKADIPPKEPAKVDPEKQKLQATNQKLRRVATAPRLQGGNQPQGAPAKQAVPQSNRGLEDFIVQRAVNSTLGRSG